MPLWLLVVLVVGGIGMTVLAVHVTGGTVMARLADERQARERYIQDFPEDQIETVVLDADGRNAVLALAGGAAGIIHAFGDRFLTRRLVGDGVVVASGDSRALTVTLDDFTCPALSMRFCDDESFDTAHAALERAGARETA